MRVGIFTQWYDPEPGPAGLMGVLARALIARGHEVYVLTGYPNYPTGTLMPGYRQRLRQREIIDGVRVTRVPLFLSHDSSAAGRLMNYFSFGLSASILGVPSLPRLDVIWVNYSPITVSLPMWAQQLRHRTPVICEVADLWPDTLLVAGLRGADTLARVGAGMLTAWCDAIYRSAAAVTYISPGVRQVLVERGVPDARLRYLPKPADESLAHPHGSSWRDRLGISQADITVVYAGAMGEAQGIESLLDACALVDDSRLAVLLAGSGTRERALKERARRLGLANVQFLGRLPQDRMADLYATADLAVISLASHGLSRVTMPSKTQAILASGVAVLCVADGDVGTLIESRSVGFVARPGDVRAIADALQAAIETGREGLAAQGRHARSVYEREFSVERLGADADELLASVLSQYRRRPPRADQDPAILTKADVREVARLHKRAFPDFFLSQLGEGFLRQFYSGFIGDPTAITAVVRDEYGAPIGVAVGTDEPSGFFRRLLRKRLLGFAGASAAAALRRPSAVRRLVRAINYRGAAGDDRDGALLSSICVDPGARGKGVGTVLLEAWVNRARERGAHVAYLATDSEGNDAVNRFYANAGWQRDSRFVTPEGRAMNRYVRWLATPPPEQAGL